MKKTLLIAIATAGLLYSCGGGPSAEELKAGAEKMCNCMADKSAENVDQSEDLKKSSDNLNYTMCALDVAFSGIDPYSDEFTAAIKENCNELSEMQSDYVKSKGK